MSIIPEKKLSIVIPAFNEEQKIALTIQEVYEAAQKVLDEFEIIVVDDGSSDATYRNAVGAAIHCGSEIQIIKQDFNKGVGAAFFIGLAQAKFYQLCLIPGDNAFNKAGIEALFLQCGTVPLVITYRQNMASRTRLRRLLSQLATLSLHIITGYKICDAHSLYLFPVEETRGLDIKSAGYGYHIEILSRLLKRVQDFSEIPVTLNAKVDESSGVMKPKTLFILGAIIIKLLGLRLLRRL